MPFVTTTETGAPIQGPTATLHLRRLVSGPAHRSAAPGKLATAMLLDIPLVLGRRSDGRVFAMRDSCPHRGIPLSYGWFDGNRVTCRYHGWEFEPCSGQCALIPSLYQPGPPRRHAHLRHRLSLRRARRARLGLHSRPRQRPELKRAASRAVRNWPNSARATAPRTSPPTCPATSTTASSA